MTDIWESLDADTTEADRAYTAVRVAAAEHWPFLAGAVDNDDFRTRLALIDDDLDVAVAKVADHSDFAVLRARLAESLEADYSQLHAARREARQRQAQQANAPRAARRAAQRKRAVVDVNNISVGDWIKVDLSEIAGIGDESGVSVEVAEVTPKYDGVYVRLNDEHAYEYGGEYLFIADHMIVTARKGRRRTAGRGYLVFSYDTSSVVVESDDLTDAVRQAVELGYTTGYVTNQDGARADLAELIPRYASRRRQANIMGTLVDNETGADLGAASPEQIAESLREPNGVIAVDDSGGVIRPGEMGYNEARRAWVDVDVPESHNTAHPPGWTTGRRKQANNWETDEVSLSFIWNEWDVYRQLGSVNSPAELKALVKPHMDASPHWDSSDDHLVDWDALYQEVLEDEYVGEGGEGRVGSRHAYTEGVDCPGSGTYVEGDFGGERGGIGGNPQKKQAICPYCGQQVPVSGGGSLFTHLLPGKSMSDRTAEKDDKGDEVPENLLRAEQDHGKALADEEWERDHSGRFSMRKGAPFAGYSDFDDCLAQNSDKDDPSAYCGKIKHQVEDSKEGRRKRVASDGHPWVDDRLEGAVSAAVADLSSGNPKAQDVVSRLGEAFAASGGYQDSFDREHAFDLASAATGIDYNAIYDAWLASTDSVWRGGSRRVRTTRRHAGLWDDYWAEADAALDQIRSARSASDVLAALPAGSQGGGFFSGDGDDMLGALMDAGWRSVEIRAGYYWAMQAPDGSIISYVEGDVFSGNQLMASRRQASSARDLEPGWVIEIDGQERVVDFVKAYPSSGDGKVYVSFDDGSGQMFPAGRRVQRVSRRRQATTPPVRVANEGAYITASNDPSFKHTVTPGTQARPGTKHHSATGDAWDWEVDGRGSGWQLGGNWSAKSGSRRSARGTSFSQWVEAIEQILGMPVENDDGYDTSVPNVHELNEMFESGMTPEEAAPKMYPGRTSRKAWAVYDGTAPLTKPLDQHTALKRCSQVRTQGVDDAIVREVEKRGAAWVAPALVAAAPFATDLLGEALGNDEEETTASRRRGRRRTAALDDIVGYVYKADIYTPDGVIEEMIRNGDASPAARDVNTEDALDQIADSMAIDRYDEWTFDSDEFPKVVFKDEGRGEEGKNAQGDYVHLASRRRTANKIDQFRKIVSSRTDGKVDGEFMDLFTASAVTKVYDQLNPSNQAKFASMSPESMADTAFKIANKTRANKRVAVKAEGLKPGMHLRTPGAGVGPRIKAVHPAEGFGGSVVVETINGGRRRFEPWEEVDVVDEYTNPLGDATARRQSSAFDNRWYVHTHSDRPDGTKDSFQTRGFDTEEEARAYAAEVGGEVQAPRSASRRKQSQVHNISTWADGFGNWHASVRQSGVGDAAEAENVARGAIRGALADREGPNFSPEVVGVELVSRTSQNGFIESEFVETNAHEASHRKEAPGTNPYTPGEGNQFSMPSLDQQQAPPGTPDDLMDGGTNSNPDQVSVPSSSEQESMSEPTGGTQP